MLLFEIVRNVCYVRKVFLTFTCNRFWRIVFFTYIIYRYCIWFSGMDSSSRSRKYNVENCPDQKHFSLSLPKSNIYLIQKKKYILKREDVHTTLPGLLQKSNIYLIQKKKYILKGEMYTVPYLAWWPSSFQWRLVK